MVNMMRVDWLERCKNTDFQAREELVIDFEQVVLWDLTCRSIVTCWHLSETPFKTIMYTSYELSLRFQYQDSRDEILHPKTSA